jgi:hypothetical protein
MRGFPSAVCLMPLFALQYYSRDTGTVCRFDRPVRVLWCVWVRERERETASWCRSTLVTLGSTACQEMVQRVTEWSNLHLWWCWSHRSARHITDGRERSTSGGTAECYSFESLKQRVESRRLQGKEEGEAAPREWLRMQEPDICRDGTVKLVPRRDKRITALGDCVDK